MIAAMVGVMRQVSNLKKKRTDRYDCPISMGWEFHILGAIGEAIFAKWRNLYWCGSLGNFDAADVGKYQVRTRSEEWHSLIVHKEDNDNDIFVMITVRGDEHTLCGWLRGHECKQDKWWDDPSRRNGKKSRPAYFIPQSTLHDMEELVNDTQTTDLKG